MSVVVVPQRGVLRVVRGAALAATTATLAVAAHAAGGGGLPDLGAAGVLTLLVAAGGTALADQQRGPLAVAAAVGATQVGLHLLLSVFSTHHHGSTVGGMTAGHVVAALVTVALLTHAERAVFAVAAALGAVLPRRLAPLPVADRTLPPSPRPVTVGHAVEVLLTRAHGRRGPPTHS